MKTKNTPCIKVSKILFSILLLLSFTVFGQASDDLIFNRKILFSYDSAGNQYQRSLCINCATGKGATPKKIEKVKPEDLKKFNPEDLISYYPNPVEQELFLKWELINNNKVNSIEIYSISGMLLKNFPNLTFTNDQIINFQEYPSGNYFLELIYSNGEQKSIQIIKK